MNALHAVLASLGLALTGPAVAQDVDHWGAVANWDVVVDHTVGNGCRIQSEFEDGSFIMLGYDPRTDQGYLTVFNIKWGDIITGESYDIELHLDAAVWSGTALGVDADGIPGGEVLVDSVDFLYDLAASQAISIWSGGEEVTTLDLAYASAALDEAVRCQDAQ